MTLNADQRRRTSWELRSNLALSGLTVPQAAADLGVTQRRLERTLDIDDAADPAEVWQLRDYLEHAVRDAGELPVPYTVLTARARHLARVWFPLRRAPRHVFPRP